MSCSSDDIFSRVLYVGPDRRSHGGIAYVVRTYEDAIGHITYAPTTNHRSKALGALRWAITMAMLPIYRMRGYRIVHAHGSVRGSWPRKCLLLRWAECLGMHSVHHIHNGALRKFFDRYGVDKARRQLAKADAVVALSHEWARYLHDEMGVEKVSVIENPVTPPTTQRVPLPGAPLRLLYLSGIDYTKGLFELLEAIDRHRTELEGLIHLDIGGSGVDDARMYDFLSTHNMSGFVTTHGWVAGEAKDRLLEHNDVFVLPSYAEGMPISLLEAMAAGLAVLSTPVGGIPEAVGRNKGGILVEPKSVEAIYDAILHFLQNPQDIDTMGAYNRHKAQEYFPQQIVSKLEALYRTFDKSNAK